MFQSTIFSKLSRLALLSVFCAGLFVTGGELRINDDSIVQMGSGGVYSAMAAETTKKTAAATPDPTAKKPDEKSVTNEAMGTLVDISNVIIKLLSIFLTPLIMLAGWLLSPDWTFGDILGLRPILHKLWILISNVVYVVFGFMLVFVAFANIFGWEHSKAYEMKTMLPKLVTGMLMVPFTWFIVSATLSVANVLTASVIQLPVSTINTAGNDKVKEYFDKKKIIPKNMTLDLTSSKKDSPTNKTFEASDCGKNPEECLTISKFLWDANGWAYNLLSVYAYGIFHVEKYMDIEKGQLDKSIIKDVTDIVKKLGFGIVFFIVFGILVIAIVYALFSRALMLWMYAIFSPIFALNYVVGSKNKSLERFTVKEFVSLAMVPVYVSAALAFGLMFLSLVMNPDNYAKWEGVMTMESGSDWKQTMKLGEVTLTTVGDPNMMDVLGEGFQTGQGLIGSVIMGFLALAILWMAVMAALGSSKITEAAVAPIKWFGDEIGKLAMKAPQYVPIPLPKGKDGKERSISMAWLGSITSQVDNALRTRAAEHGAAIWKTFAEGLWLQVSALWETLRQTTLSIKQHPNNLPAQKEDWRKALASIWDSATLDSQKAMITPKFQEMLQSTTINPTKRAELEKLLADWRLPEFIKELEHYFDKEWNGGFTHVPPEQTDAYLKSIKNNTTSATTPTVTVSAVTIPDPTKPNIKKVDVHMENKPDISVEIKDGRINHETVKSQLNANGITDKEEIRKVITEIESQLPKAS